MTLSAEQKSVLLEIARDAARFDEPLANYSTMRIGGPADALVAPRDPGMLKSVMRWASENEINYMFLGGGSDTLIRDGGIRGVVIHLKDGFKNCEVLQQGDESFVKAGAGVPTGFLVNFAKENGLKGVEGLAGIPGTVGGNVMTNAGTSLGWISESVEEITVVDKHLRELTIKKKALEFSYRHLRLPRSTAVISATLRLARDDQSSIDQRISELLNKRKTTQPYGQPTLGCMFKNPEKGGKKSASAGALIDEAGLKGVRVGKARVSDIHANFIINEGGATSKDVEVLMGLVKEHVKEKFGTILEPEIHIVGEK